MSGILAGIGTALLTGLLRLPGRLAGVQTALGFIFLLYAAVRLLAARRDMRRAEERRRG